MTDASILFLDQTGALGGGELALRDLVSPYRDRCRVVLFADGALRDLLEDDGVAVTVLEGGLAAVRRESGPVRAMLAAPAAVDLVRRVAAQAGDADLVYTNSQKALLIGAAAARLTGLPLVSHLHDILSAEHFSPLQRRLSVVAANRGAQRVIADSEATAKAFVDAGGRADKVEVVYYGFDRPPPPSPGGRAAVRDALGIDRDAFVVGHVGRLSPWKGQEVLIQALARLRDDTVGMIVGRALFGEDDLARSLPELGRRLGLDDRLVFTGFRSDVTDLMRACDLVVHSSTSPEPFGRVIVEAMLAGVPVVAARAGGPCEIIEDGRTGWLTEPGDVAALAARIRACRDDPGGTRAVAEAAATSAATRFTMASMHRGVARVIDEVLAGERRSGPGGDGITGR